MTGAELPPRLTQLTFHRLVTPGGRVLLAEGFWHRTPTEAELAGMAYLTLVPTG